MPLTGSYWSTPIVRVGERTYTWRDVVLFAMVTGEWDAFAADLALGLACAHDAGEHDDWPDDGVLDEAATAFRYDRDLLTSEETEAWLERHGLSLDSWSDALMRDVLRRDRGDRVTAGELEPDDIDGPTLIAEGVCTGAFPRWAGTLAARAAVAQLHDGTPVPDADTAATMTGRYAAWLEALDDVEAHVQPLVAAVAADRAVIAAALTAEALATHVDRARLDWVRVDLEQLTFPSIDAAREAALCVREDGLTLSEVAIESRQPVVDARTLLDALDPALRDAVLSASPGDTIGPIETAGGVVVAHVVGKAAASLDDPLVRARAERSVIEALRERAAVAHARWLQRPR
ncbi:MAG: hypothetical protein U0P30_01540 [Vicinamibacterales bacterium]